MTSSTLRDGLLDGLLPAGLEPRLQVVADASFRRDTTGLRTADLFGDGSYRLVDLPGHAAGHVGALVEGRVLLAGTRPGGVRCSARRTGSARSRGRSPTTTPPRSTPRAACSPRSGRRPPAVQPRPPSHGVDLLATDEGGSS